MARGFLNRSEAVITLDLTMVADAAGVGRVAIEGRPPLVREVKGGVHGELGTAPVIINAVHGLNRIDPGLHTMPDLVRAHYGRRLKAAAGAGWDFSALTSCFRLVPVQILLNGRDSCE